MGNLPGGRWGEVCGPVKYKIKMKLTRVLWKRKCWGKWSNRRSSWRRRLQTGRDIGELVHTWWGWDRQQRNVNLQTALQCFELGWDDFKIGLTPGAKNLQLDKYRELRWSPKEVVDRKLTLVKNKREDSLRRNWVGNEKTETSLRMDSLRNLKRFLKKN